MRNSAQTVMQVSNLSTPYQHSLNEKQALTQPRSEKLLAISNSAYASPNMLAAGGRKGSVPVFK